MSVLSFNLSANIKQMIRKTDNPQLVIVKSSVNKLIGLLVNKTWFQPLNKLERIVLASWKEVALKNTQAIFTDRNVNVHPIHEGITTEANLEFLFRKNIAYKVVNKP